MWHLTKRASVTKWCTVRNLRHCSSVWCTYLISGRFLLTLASEESCQLSLINMVLSQGEDALVHCLIGIASQWPRSYPQLKTKNEGNHNDG